MPDRSLQEFRPRLERLEARLNLSASASHTAASQVAAVLAAATAHPSDGSLLPDQTGNNVLRPGQNQTSPVTGITEDRITTPSPYNLKNFKPPFGHVQVGSNQPVPGKTYNLLFISVYNGTSHTFTAADNITVRTSNNPVGTSFPVLTGNQEWQPGQRILFYTITNRYYTLNPTQSAGFKFNFVHPVATAVPGPSGIVLRVKYNPSTINAVLDKAATSGPGAIGYQYGLPDTALWEVIPASPKLEYL